ncbi:hypothetical protein GUJ93_ZPchr0004g40024 [Zizania palustris]|uniref:tRNA pseudouridine(55) synthase n=1 Tax=Zizania palustris TaxID=103762 RepID=A0A8J5SK88_ZIZPA|nr:hypothetical protein GUJ93_ZPchr0004g40024 [Zizania palustris]
MPSINHETASRAMTATGGAAEVDAEARAILQRAAAVASFPPFHAVHHLLSVGVCVRCIFRLCGAFSDACTCLSLTASSLHSFIEEHDDSVKSVSCSCLATDEAYCSICFGVLLPTCYQDGAVEQLHSVTPIDNITSMISQAVQREGYQVDDFSLEISLPAVVAANERAIRLCMKEKYGNANWFSDKMFSQQTMPVKEALRLLLVPSLERQMNVKHGNNSFRIRLMYTHDDGSQKLLNLLPNDRGRKRKAESRDGSSTKRNSTDDDKNILSESDSFINKTLEGIQDQEFCSLFQLPPEKMLKPCHLVISCLRSPIYIGGRYLKLSRNVSQSCWIIDDERMGEASVEEIIGEHVRAICRGDGYKFHAAGREDIDVRMLGSGRPFLVEVLNVRSIPSATEVQQIADKINSSEKKHVRIRNLKLVGSEIWTMMREGEAEKQKQYTALIWTSRPLTDNELHNISLIKDMEIVQKTPIRVLHRRSPLERKRIIHWMEIEKIADGSNYYLLHLCTQVSIARL